MATILLPEWDIYKTPTEMEIEFWRGDHFRFPNGGYTNCWMLKPGEYYLESRALCTQVLVAVTAEFHIAELESMQEAGLGYAADEQIAEWHFTRFCHLVDMRYLYANRQKITPSSLIHFIKKED